MVADIFSRSCPRPQTPLPPPKYFSAATTLRPQEAVMSALLCLAIYCFIPFQEIRFGIIIILIIIDPSCWYYYYCFSNNNIVALFYFSFFHHHQFSWRKILGLQNSHRQMVDSSTLRMLSLEQLTGWMEKPNFLLPKLVHIPLH